MKQSSAAAMLLAAMLLILAGVRAFSMDVEDGGDLDAIDSADSREPADWSGLRFSCLRNFAPAGKPDPAKKENAWPTQASRSISGRVFAVLDVPRSFRIRIPQAGTYRLWISYLARRGTAVPFEMTAGGTKHVFGATPVGDTASSKQKQALPIRFDERDMPVPGAECVVWEFRDTALAEGEMAIELAPRTASPAPMLESFFATQALSFTPSRSSAAEKKTLDRTYVRIRFEGKGAPAVVRNALLYRARHPAPGTKRGLFQGSIGPGGQFGAGALEAGVWSDWQDATAPLNNGGGLATCFLRSDKVLDGSLTLQLAWQPSGHAVLRELVIPISGTETLCLVPVWRDEPAAPALEDQAAFAVRDGRPLERMADLAGIERMMDGYARAAIGETAIPKLSALRLHASDNTPEAARAKTARRLQSLGLTWITPPPANANELGLLPENLEYFYINVDANALHPDNEGRFETMLRKVSQRRQGKGPLYGIKLGDEIGMAVSAEAVNASERGLTLFRNYLRTELALCKKEPAWLGVPSIDEARCMVAADVAKPEPEQAEREPEEEREREDDPAPRADNGNVTHEQLRLAYLSRRFIEQTTVEYYHAATRAAQKVFPGVRTFANVSTGFMLTGRLNPNWVQLARSGAVTTAWGEDWAWPEKGTASCGLQTVSFYGAILDCASRFNGGDKGFHTIATCGNADRKMFALLGEGVFGQDLYMYGPAYLRAGGGIDCWSEKPHVYAQIATALRAAAPAERFLVQGKPEPARVAVLLNQSDTYRFGDGIPPMISECLLAYLALRHDHMPVDLVLESDIAEDRIKDYGVLYLSGLRLQAACVARLQAWVAGGGILVVAGGTGFADEFGDPLPEFRTLLGVTQEIAQVQGRSWHADQLPKLPLLDTAAFGSTDCTQAARVPVVGLKMRLLPEQDCRVLASYADGTPAAISRQIGKGRVIFYGFLPGLSYRRDGMRDPDAKQRISGYRADVRALFARPARLGAPAPRVTLSDAGIETAVFEHPDGLALLLTDYGWNPERTITIRVTEPAPIATVTSANRGALEFSQNAGAVEFVIKAPDPVDSIILMRKAER